MRKDARYAFLLRLRDFLREDDVERDEQVAPHQVLVERVTPVVVFNTFAVDALNGLGCNNLVYRQQYHTTVKQGNFDRLALNGILQRDRVRVEQVVSLPAVARSHGVVFGCGVGRRILEVNVQV